MEEKTDVDVKLYLLNLVYRVAKEINMEFSELIKVRQSTRSYDPTREVEEEKIEKILEAARLSPSACNGQPYHITVCKGEYARKIASSTRGGAKNGFCKNVPLFLVITEKPYVERAEAGSKIMGINYREIDIGLLSAHITLMAANLSLGSCMIGWRNDDMVREITGIDAKSHLIIAIGYPSEDDKIRDKVRKDLFELVNTLE